MVEKVNPNHLTTARLVLAPIIMYLLLHQSFWSLAFCLGLMGLAELTDGFDGHLARKYNKVSDLGKIYDPMCDALYHLMVFLCLIPSGLPIWVMAIFIVRDLIVAYARAYCAANGFVMAARDSGKYKAVSQAVFQFAFVLYLFFGLWDGLPPDSQLFIDLYNLMVSAGVVAVGLTLYSLYDYMHFVERKIHGTP